GRADVALEPLLQRDRLPGPDQVARGLRPRHGPGPRGPHGDAERRAEPDAIDGEPGPEPVPPALGQGVGRRAELAERPDAPVPSEPGPRPGPSAGRVQGTGHGL